MDCTTSCAVRWRLASRAASSRSAGVVARPVLVQAAYLGKVHILKHLLEAGADLSMTDRQGFTALLAAAQPGHADCIKLLLAAGADANKAGSLGITPLMESIMSRRTECAEALLPASDLRITSNQGRTAFHICVLHGNDECFDLLLPHVSDVDERSVPGMLPSGGPVPQVNSSPLHFALLKGRHRMAKALLKRGADVMARDSLQHTPLTRDTWPTSSCSWGSQADSNRLRPRSTWRMTRATLHSISPR